jgi:thiosulfate dehydrogenase (quinone) large subunit
MGPSAVNTRENLDAALGYALLRLTMGLDLLFHSYTRWLDLDHFVTQTVSQFAAMPLPEWAVRTVALAIPIWEPIVGILLVIGLWTRAALLGGAVLIAVLVIGTAMRANYAVLSEQLIYALYFFVLFLFRHRFDWFGIDGFRHRRGGGQRRSKETSDDR